MDKTDNLELLEVKLIKENDTRAKEKKEKKITQLDLKSISAPSHFLHAQSWASNQPTLTNAGEYMRLGTCRAPVASPFMQHSCRGWKRKK